MTKTEVMYFLNKSGIESKYSGKQRKLYTSKEAEELLIDKYGRHYHMNIKFSVVFK